MARGASTPIAWSSPWRSGGARILHPSASSQQLAALVTPKQDCNYILFGDTDEVRTGHIRAASSCTKLQPQQHCAQKPSDTAEIRRGAFLAPSYFVLLVSELSGFISSIGHLVFDPHRRSIGRCNLGVVAILARRYLPLPVVAVWAMQICLPLSIVAILVCLRYLGSYGVVRAMHLYR